MTPMIDAEMWLREMLAGGPMPSREIRALAGEVGITAKALRGAHERLDLIVKRSGNGRAMRSTWELPLSIALGLEAAGIDAQNAFVTYARTRARDQADASASGGNFVEVKMDADPVAEERATVPASGLENFEQARVSRREAIFARRGIAVLAAQHLAVRLVLERDRCSPPQGNALSCIECQERDRCDQRHAWAEIHYCHLARRDVY